MNWPNRLGYALLVVSIVAVACAMAGCASFDYEWQKARPPAPKPWMRVMVAEVDPVCRQAGATFDGRILGCAVWSRQGCTIYLVPDAPAWVIAHEERHCEGWDHL